MKIFHWDDVNVLQQHSSGDVIVIASSKEEAVSLAVQEYGPDGTGGYERGTYENQEALERELKRKEPQIFEAPKAFLINGSA